MSTRPLIGNREYSGHETNANQAKCLKPWCNITVGLLSIVVIAFFIAWTVANDDTSKHKHKPISDYSRIEMLNILSDDDGYTDEAKADLVIMSELPNVEGTYDFMTFSGYIEATNSRMIHYWFVEAETDADSSPVFLWTNGGPGCSGLLGMLTENGPFWVYPDLSLRANDYSWNQYVNMIYLEQPYGVGFSDVADDESCVVGDTAAVEDMDAALRSFMTKFPKFSNNDLYISSESFGGHYMPRLALQILENNVLESSTLKFKGLMVGNPYTDRYENEMGFVGALFGHGITKSDNYDNWMENCWGDTEAMETLYCDELYIVSYMEAYDMNVYALDYSNCPMDGIGIDNTSSSTDDSSYGAYFDDDDENPKISEAYMAHYLVKRRIEKLMEIEDVESKLTRIKKNDLIEHKSKIEASYQSNTGSPWIACSDYYMARYLNLDSVKEALHVDTTTDWAMCSYAVFYGWPESDWDNGMETVYHTLVDDYDIKMMIYSGDDDSVCGIQGTMYWLNNMGWTEDVTSTWEAWIVENQLSGFYTRFLTDEGDVALHFQSVRSAGHMVPTTQPMRALALLDKYLYQLD